MRIFITGTDTNIGKTIISSWICWHNKMNYWKPIQSGDDNGLSDTDFMKKICENKIRVYDPLYSFLQPLSPHLAAKINNQNIDLSKILFSLPKDNRMLIEGAGGVFVPLNDKFMMIDLIEILDAPVIIVAKSGLGTINHTCLTISALRDRNIKILGVIMNGEKNQENKRAIEFYGKTKVLFEFPVLKNLEDLKTIDCNIMQF